MGDDSFTYQLAGLSISFIFASSLAFFKLYHTQKNRVNPTPYLEDWFLLGGVVLALVIFVYTWIAHIRHHFGAHINSGLSISDMQYTPKFMITTGNLMIWTHAFLRMSLLIAIRRLYSPFKTSMRMLCDGCICFLLLVSIGGSIACALGNPSGGSTLQSLLQALKKYSGAPITTTIVIIILSLVLDCVILLSPLALVFQLKEIKRPARAREIQFGLIISFGFLTISASIVRLYETIRLQHKFGLDITWYFPVFVIVSQVETVLAIITTSLPTASFLLKWLYRLPTSQITSPRNKQNLPGYSDVSFSTVCVGTNSDLDKSVNLNIMLSHTPTSIKQNSFMNDISKHERAVISFGEYEPRLTDPERLSQTVQDSLSISSRHEYNNSSRASNVINKDHEEENAEDDANFFDLLYPSDLFFPFATQLGPRPVIVEK